MSYEDIENEYQDEFDVNYLLAYSQEVDTQWSLHFTLVFFPEKFLTVIFIEGGYKSSPHREIFITTPNIWSLFFRHNDILVEIF